MANRHPEISHMQELFYSSLYSYAQHSVWNIPILNTQIKNKLGKNKLSDSYTVIVNGCRTIGSKAVDTVSNIY